MSIQIEKITIDKKALLAEMLKVMQHREDEVNYEYPHLDDYWTNNDYIPYFINAAGDNIENETVGFVLINTYFWVLPHEKNNYGVAEIYVKPEFRRRGIARDAMFRLFEMHPGNWEIRPLDLSPDAQGFWEQTIGAYTHGNYKTTCFGKYKRPIYTLQAPVVTETGHEIVYREAYMGFA